MSEQNIEQQIADLEAQVREAEAAAPEKNENDNSTRAETHSSAQETAQTEYDPDAVKKMAEKLAEEKLAGIKQKLNEAYAARDEAVKAKVQLEDEKRQAEIKRMEDEGRHKEVAELKMAELQAKLEALQAENTKLSRYHSVNEAMRGLDFRSEIAGEMARDRVLAQLVQDEHGIWRHNSGVSIKEFVDTFSKDEENSFLFKAKTNSGAGSQAFAGITDNAAPVKPITEMNTEELLEHFSKQAPSTPYGNY